MVRFSPPVEQVTLYETGFSDNDAFGRARLGKSLSRVVDRIEDPLVIALDGPWGCGKTWFLERWVGAHRAQNGGKAKTVYFDAFAHDFLDDPLIALVGLVKERAQNEKSTATIKKMTGAAARLARPVARIGLAAATAGISELTGAALDAAIAAGGKEVADAAEAFWKREDGRREAMKQLRDALSELTKPEKDSAPVPLVVVVDELDRCRPDYALALLEVIKHFFAAPNIHFVLGVNMNALQHSVRVRYGADFDAERYLRRFVSIEMRLTDNLEDHDSSPLVEAHLVQTAGAMGLSLEGVEPLKNAFGLFASNRGATLRDANRLLSHAALVDPNGFRANWPVSSILSSLVLFRCFDPVLESKALDGRLRFTDVCKFFGCQPKIVAAKAPEYSSLLDEIVLEPWELLLVERDRQDDRRYEHFRRSEFKVFRKPRDALSYFHRKYLAQFHILGS